ncbi:MAG: ABC transporter substrate-binding protein [Candidatus Bathyarchaeia archaeon]
MEDRYWTVIAIVLMIVGASGGYYGGTLTAQTPEEVVSKADYDALMTEYEALREVSLPEEIKIGVAYPLSGALAPITLKIVKAAELAAKSVNDTGGIAGRPVRLIFEDTAAEPEKCLEAVKKLVEVDGVEVIVGPATTPSMLAVAEYLNRRKVPLISPSATATKISEEGGPYLFRTVPSDDLQTAALADLVKAKGWKKIATFVLANDYGIGMEQGLKNNLEKVAPEAELVKSVRYDPEKMDYRSELQLVKDANPDVIFFATWVEEGYVIFRQALEIGLDDIPTFGGEGMCDVAFFDDPSTGEFMIKTHMVGTKPASPTDSYYYQRFYREYKETFGEEPSLYGDYMFDATMIAILGVAKAGVYNGAEIKDAIPSVAEHYIGATGQKAMDENGDPLLSTYDIWEVVEGDEGPEYNFIGRWERAAGITWK